MKRALFAKWLIFLKTMRLKPNPSKKNSIGILYRHTSRYETETSSPNQ